MKRIKAALAVAGLVVATGCVSQRTYDRAVSRTQLTSAELAQKSEALEKRSAELESRREQNARLRGDVRFEREARAEEARRYRQYTDQLEREQYELEAELEIADDLVEVYRELSLRLGTPIDAGDLDIILHDNRMVISLSSDVLFDSGRTDIKAKGELALTAVAEALKALPDREFQIAGHTDSTPIASGRFPSNWELSMARAIRVLRSLSAKGVPIASLSAAAYADVDPVASNDDPDGRRQNRRIEITLQPRIEPALSDPP